jgi:hypothetical protein
LFLILLKYPSFTAKAPVKKFPIVGKIAEVAFDTYFLNRAGTAEERIKLVMLITNFTCIRLKELAKDKG